MTPRPHARAREDGRLTAGDVALFLVCAALAFAGTFAIGIVLVGAPAMIAMVVGWLP